MLLEIVIQICIVFSSISLNIGSVSKTFALILTFNVGYCECGNLTITTHIPLTQWTLLAILQKVKLKTFPLGETSEIMPIQKHLSKSKPNTTTEMCYK